MHLLYRPLFILCIAAIALLSACHKSLQPVSAVTASPALSSLFASLRTAPYTTCVSASSRQVVYAPGGIKLTFYPGSFLDKGGSAVTAGLVTLQITEVYGIGGQMENRLSALADVDAILVSSSIYITAAMEGSVLHAKSYGIEYPQKTVLNQSPILYYGSPSVTDSSVTWATGHAGLTVTDSTIDSERVVIITNAGPDTVINIARKSGTFYKFDSCSSFGWLQCGAASMAAVTAISVTAYIADTSFTNANTEVYVVVRQTGGALLLPSYNSSLHGFSLTGPLRLPPGAVADIYAIGNKNGTYYYGFHSAITIGANSFVSLSMQPMALADVLGSLNGI